MGGPTKINLEIPDDPRIRAFIEGLLATNQSLRDHVRELERMVFGRSSERGRGLADFDVTQQGLLPFVEFLEARRRLEERNKNERDDRVHIPAHDRKKHGRRADFPPHLPRYRHEHLLSEDKRKCCGQEMRRIGFDDTDSLERIEYCYVRVDAKEKCVCDKCGAIRQATGPERIFDRSLLGTSFIANLAYERFSNHVPYARFESKLKDEGILLSRSVICESVLRAADLLEPVQKALKADVLAAELVQSDDTEILQRNGNMKGSKKVCFWVYRSGGRGAFFELTDKRSRDGPALVLENFQGLLQTDGHRCFKGLHEGITGVGCWAHARRKYVAAIRGGDKLAEEGYALIQKIFLVERELSDLGDSSSDREKRRRVRQELSRSVVEDLGAWVEMHTLNPPRGKKSLFMKAVTYTKNQWQELTRFLEDGRIRDITNNASERALRGPVVGRKNWLFFGSEEGARRSAILLSLVQTCRELGVNAKLYLADVLRRLATTPASEVATLTPRHWNELYGDAAREAYAKELAAIAPADAPATQEA